MSTFDKKICLFYQLFRQFIKANNVRVVYKVDFNLKIRAIQRGACYL